MKNSAGKWIFLLLFFQLRYPSAFARLCTCTTEEFGGCNHGVCTAPHSSTQSVCEMSVRVAPNNTVTEVKHYCLTGLIPPCEGPPEVEPSGFLTYYACCGDADECNRCLVPSELPDEAKQEIELNRDCNHSSLLNQTASPSLKSTDPSLVSPPPSKDAATERHYLYAALAVGCATVVCLVAVPMIVLAVWWRREHLLSRAVHKTEDDQVTDTINTVSIKQR